MELFNSFWTHLHNMPIMLILGLLSFIGFYTGRGMRSLKLPSILAYMLVGIAIGPSGIDLLPNQMQENLSFIIQITLAFVALNIGLELNLKSLNSLGSGIIWIILFETFATAIFVTGIVYFVSGNLALALIFGSIAPASAPAGTVAVIRESNAKGPLTKTLYAIVGFDDGITIIIFGFSAALAKSLITDSDVGLLQNLWHSFKEIFYVCLIGTVMSYLFSRCVRPLEKPRNMLILTVCFVMITIGLSEILHISMVLTNMMLGFVMSNTQSREVLRRIEIRLEVLMPMLFILFFIIAGAGLYINKLISLGLLGCAYIASRTFGLIGGAWFGAIIGNMPKAIKKYVGMGILSQAGVAIGLALIVKHDFQGIGELVNGEDHSIMIPMGTYIGATVLTTVTATSVFFEILGPILTRIALKKAEEIS